MTKFDAGLFAIAGRRLALMDTEIRRMKELQELLRQADIYRQVKPIHDEWNGIKWKSKREQFKEAHDADLRIFFMARRKLDIHFSSDGKLPLTAWQQGAVEHYLTITP